MALKAVLIDLSGTLHIGNQPTRDAARALDKLRKRYPVRACSNTSKESRASLLKRLANMELHFQEDELFSSLAAAASACRNLRPLLLLSESAKEDFEGIGATSPEEADSVVVGLAPEALNYQRMNEAFRVLLKKDAKLMATHRALYLKDEDGQLSIGPGGFVIALEQASEKQATVVGKPERGFFEQCLQSFDGLGLEDYPQVAIVGDDYRNDLGGGAEELGLQRYLVRTGKYREGDENKASSLTGVYDDFAAFVEAVCD